MAEPLPELPACLVLQSRLATDGAFVVLGALHRLVAPVGLPPPPSDAGP